MRGEHMKPILNYSALALILLVVFVAVARGEKIEADGPLFARRNPVDQEVIIYCSDFKTFRIEVRYKNGDTKIYNDICQK